MELRVIEKTDEELRIEIAGEDHTFYERHQRSTARNGWSGRGDV